MKFCKYLEQRGISTAITKKEAEIAGLAYPLQQGWRDRYANLSLSDDQVKEMRLSLGDREKRRIAHREKKQAQAENKLRRTAEQSKPKRKTVNQQIEELLKKRPFEASNEFLSSYEWRKIRMEALKKHGRRCQCCGASPANGAVLNVDHIKPRLEYPHLALELSNLQVLCHDCNHGKGNWDKTDWRRMRT